MERIRQLKITSYEKELEAKHAKLQYLQLQIRPHFYLNCLKNLYALAETKQYHSIQNTILALSGYLRFIFRDNMKRIPLSQELRSIRDYMQLRLSPAARPVRGNWRRCAQSGEKSAAEPAGTADIFIRESRIPEPGSLSAGHSERLAHRRFPSAQGNSEML